VEKSFLYLAGTILEFSGGINGKGFIFNNQMQIEHVDVERVSL
jgi:Fe-S cluster assembly iron-binding protein IscA